VFLCGHAKHNTRAPKNRLNLLLLFSDGNGFIPKNCEIAESGAYELGSKLEGTQKQLLAEQRYRGGKPFQAGTDANVA
jgi:hypothetical protein